MAYEDLLGKIGDFLNNGARSIRDRLTLDTPDLLRAIDANDPEEVARALRAGVKPDKDDGIGRFPLHLAADNNYTLIVGLLLKSNADPDLRDADGQTALLKAVSWENTDMVHLLLDAGADPNLADSKGLTPIADADNKGYTAIAEMLREFKANQKAERRRRDKATHEELRAKAAAAREQREEKARREVEREAAKAERAARRAREKAEKEVAKRYPAVKDGNYLHAFILALSNQDQESASLLFEKLEDLNAVDPDTGTSPLMAALVNKSSALSIKLIEAGADVASVVTGQQHSPLTYAIVQGYEKPVQLMLSQYPEGLADVLNQSDQLLSPQFLAYKDAQIMNLLLEAGADPFFGGSAAPSPIIKAIEKASIAILPVLARHKVDLNTRLAGRTPLEWAIHFNRQPWLIGLLEEGVNIDAMNEAGLTPLMQAVLAGQTESIRILMDEGADSTLKDSEGRTATQLAEGNEAILALLS